MTLLSVRDLRKLYPLRPGGGSTNWLGTTRGRPAAAKMLHAVDGVDLDIASGETVGLVGESGCGKSTLARILARLVDPTSGEVWLEGREVSAVPPHRFALTGERCRIQMVFQDPTDSLNPRFNAFDAIAEPVRRLERLGADEVGHRVHAAADMVGLAKELLTRFPHQLSGGQKARVGIARAIVVRPSLLILDEPTSALDVSVQALILQLLDQLRGQLGVSYLFVSHDLNIVRLLCHRVVVMYMGKIIESGPAAALFRSPAHPYTQMLLAAIPSRNRSRDVERADTWGEPGSPIDPSPSACRFAGRCSRQSALCTERAPELRSMASGHLVACHFPQSSPPSEECEVQAKW